MFDFVLLVVLLGLMLPFIFSAIPPLTDMETWGFEIADDKTMKQHGGDVLALDELYADDTMTAAEIVLLTRVHDRETVRHSRYRLPNGTVITVDGDYPVFIDASTAKVQAALDPALRYRLTYSYEAGMWVFQ
jgi:uncharacterized iron-regulated protein